MVRKPDRGKIARQQAKNVRKSNPDNEAAEEVAKEVDRKAAFEDIAREES